jgi:hypothetical protein
MKTDTPTLIAALRILANEIESGDGVANAAIAEGADRLEELAGVGPQVDEQELLLEIIRGLTGHRFSPTQGWEQAAKDVRARLLKNSTRFLCSKATEPVDYLKILEDQCWDLRCVDTGGGYDDGDIGWRIFGHWMSQPQERIIGYGDTPLAAINDAMRPRDYEGNLIESDPT